MAGRITQTFPVFAERAETKGSYVSYVSEKLLRHFRELNPRSSKDAEIGVALPDTADISEYRPIQSKRRCTSLES